jgi:hypothetical protein
MYMCRTGMVLLLLLLLLLLWCLYQVVFFFILGKDDSEMLRLSENLSNFSMTFTEKRHSCKPLPPPPNEHMTFLVEKIDM